MPARSKRLLLPKKLRAAHNFSNQKFTKNTGKTLITRIENCMSAVLTIMREIMPEKRNINIDLFRAALNMLCINATTIRAATEKPNSQPLLRPTAVYSIIKKFFPNVGVCSSTTKCMTTYFNILADELVTTAKSEAAKSRRTMLTERDIQIASLYVENVCILLKGRNDAAFVPSLI